MTLRSLEDVIRSVQKKHPTYSREHCEKIAKTIVGKVRKGGKKND